MGKGSNSITFGGQCNFLGDSGKIPLWDLVPWHFQVLSTAAWEYRSYLLRALFSIIFSIPSSLSMPWRPMVFNLIRWPSFLMIYAFVFNFEKAQDYSLKLHFHLFTNVLSSVRKKRMELKLNPRDPEIPWAHGSLMRRVGELLGQAPVSLGNAWLLGKLTMRWGGAGLGMEAEAGSFIKQLLSNHLLWAVGS